MKVTYNTFRYDVAVYTIYCLDVAEFSIRRPAKQHYYQVRDMTAFVISYCIVTHIKITIQSLYFHPMPYCDHNADSPFLFHYFFYISPLWTF